jgi:GcrA cell cycle regulator
MLHRSKMSQRMPNPISYEEERLIIKMWKERKTGSEIASATGRSRNSIMGKLNRLRAKGVITLLPEGESRFKPKNLAQSTGVRKKVPSMPKMPPLKTETAPEEKDLADLFVPPPPPPKEENVKPIKFIDLKPMSCRWVVSGKRAEEFLFCGKRKERGAYCAEHGAMSYVSVSKRGVLKEGPFKLEKMSGFLNK